MDRYIPGRNRKGMQSVPSLLDLCIQTAIDNVRYLGDVGGTDEQFLGEILPHCTAEQLKHVEDSTEGRDLSPTTDCLWKNFYEKKFGERSFNSVVDKMRSKKVTFKWRKLYEAKLKDVEEAQQNSIERMKQLYQNEDAQKKSRQVKLCTKVPPSSHKRNCYGGWGPGSIVGSSKSSLMKKSKVDFLNSFSKTSQMPERCRTIMLLVNCTYVFCPCFQHNVSVLSLSIFTSQEVRNLTALRKNVVQKNDRPVCIRKPGSILSKGSTSTSQTYKPFQRR